MKTIAISSILIGSAAALVGKAANTKPVAKGKVAPAKGKVAPVKGKVAPVKGKAAPTKPSFSIESLPGILPPVGFFDPFNFAGRADEATILRYREAEIAHGRVGMLAVIGFLVGEKVEGSSFLFDASIKGPAITHISQVPDLFLPFLITFIGAYEAGRSLDAFADPANLRVDEPGKLKPGYAPGNLKFDPFNLKPKDPEDLFQMQNRELQNGRLAMLAAAGFIAQEGVDGKGIYEHAFGPEVLPAIFYN